MHTKQILIREGTGVRLETEFRRDYWHFEQTYQEQKTRRKGKSWEKERETVVLIGKTETLSYDSETPAAYPCGTGRVEMKTVE